MAAEKIAEILLEMEVERLHQQKLQQEMPFSKELIQLMMVVVAAVAGMAEEQAEVLKLGLQQIADQILLVEEEDLPTLIQNRQQLSIHLDVSSIPHTI